MANGIELKPGKITDFDGSMAKAMEDAFIAIWPEIMGNDEPKTSDNLKMMFIAISQGVVKHLSDNAEAFKVTVKSEGSPPDEIDPKALHKHVIEKSDNITNGTDQWTKVYNHTHPISETDTHHHESEVSIDTDGLVI